MVEAAVIHTLAGRMYSRYIQSVDRSDGDAKVRFMRDCGAVSATWDDKGRLRSIELGAAPAEATQEKKSAAVKPRDYRTVILASGSTLRPRLPVGSQ